MYTQDGWTPLHLAARWGRIDAMRVLVDEGHADVNIKTSDGRTAGEILKCELSSAETKEAIKILGYKPHTANDAASTAGSVSSLSQCAPIISCINLEPTT
jgi:ankyrin repeat protein